eukprot:XP_028345494.1 6-phosphogluconate dehydrogenase, decarboxylating 1-like [Physeter catodon]
MLSDKLRPEAASLSKGNSHLAEKAVTEDKELADIEKALLCGKICCYAQGMQLLAAVSRLRKWNMNLAEICRIWKGGCIIRAKFLDTLASAFLKNPCIQSVLLDDHRRLPYQMARQPQYHNVDREVAGSGAPLPRFPSHVFGDSGNCERWLTPSCVCDS